MGAQGKSSSPSNSLRVKVYRLNDDGKWDDQGTGHVRVDYMEGCQDLGLVVVDEEDNEHLLLHRICSNDIYRRQEETIISWRDPELSTELALSFQEATGCSYIWDQICGVQRDIHFSNLGDLEIGPRPALESLEASAALQSNDESFRSINNELRDLPAVELSTLPLILKMVLECGITDQMHVAELILQDQEFFPKLIDLFRMCEDLENMDGLRMIFRLVKGIISLNCPQIFERIFADEYILDIIGSLEYDPDVPRVQQHRAFLKEHVVFKEAIPIKDSSILSRIHQTYRIGYIKDVILPRVLDEATIASLNMIINTNNAAVISSLKDDASFIQELFARMRSTSSTTGSREDLVLFLHEFCSLSKSLQIGQQLRLFRDLATEGIFGIITNMLESHNRKHVSAGTDILILFLNQDANLLRSYVVQQEGSSLLGLLVKGMTTDFGEDMHCQFLEIIRILLDSYNTAGMQRDTIIEIFYEKHLDHLVDVIAASCPPRHLSSVAAKSYTAGVGAKYQGVTKPEILSNICELLCFCVIHHPYKIKSNFLMGNAIEKILFLTRRRERYLVVAAVRFMRTVISRNDEQLVRHIVKNNLLKPIIEAFIENGNRYNMLHSGVLELLEHIRKDNKSLVMYIVESFWDQLLKFQSLATIQGLKIKYDQTTDNPETKNIGAITDSRKKMEERTLEKEEEDYFNEDSDEDDSAGQLPQSRKQNTRKALPNGIKANCLPARPGSVGLVDYDDDDDDEAYNPPSKKPEASVDIDDNDSLPKIKRKLSSDSKDEKLEVTKKQKLDVRVNVAALVPNCGNSNSSSKRSPLCGSKTATDNGEFSSSITEKRSASSHAPINQSDPKDIRHSSGTDCPTASLDNPPPDRVVNGKDAPGSEPYSVR